MKKTAIWVMIILSLSSCSGGGTSSSNSASNTSTNTVESTLTDRSGVLKINGTRYISKDGSAVTFNGKVAKDSKGNIVEPITKEVYEKLRNIVEIHDVKGYHVFKKEEYKTHEKFKDLDKYKEVDKEYKVSLYNNLKGLNNKIEEYNKKRKKLNLERKELAETINKDIAEYKNTSDEDKKEELKNKIDSNIAKHKKLEEEREELKEKKYELYVKKLIEASKDNPELIDKMSEYTQEIKEIYDSVNKNNSEAQRKSSSIPSDSKKNKEEIDNLKKQVAANTKRIEEVAKENRQGIALTTAMAQINPLGMNEGKFSAGVGMGYFKGETGLAFGVGYGISEGISLSSKGAFATSDFSTFAIGAGINFEF